MSQDLVYTSATRGLKPGSHGYCTVACTHGMSKPLAERLERLSGYRHDKSARNPVAHSHVTLTIGGKRFHVVSRVADAGLDYSGRENKIAHHVVFDQDELVDGGPAWCLAQPGFHHSEWTGEPKWLPPRDQLVAGELAPRECSAWRTATGDAGWGGVVAESVLAKGSHVGYIIYDDSTPLLPLLVECQSILLPSLRWQMTFTTYFHGQDLKGVDCQWRCVLSTSPEARKVRSRHDKLVLDLTRRMNKASDTEFTRAARDGRFAVVEETQRTDPLHCRSGSVGFTETAISLDLNDDDAELSLAPPDVPRSEPIDYQPAAPRIPSGLDRRRRSVKRLWLAASASLLALVIIAALILVLDPQVLPPALSPRGEADISNAIDPEPNQLDGEEVPHVDSDKDEPQPSIDENFDSQPPNPGPDESQPSVVAGKRPGLSPTTDDSHTEDDLVPEDELERKLNDISQQIANIEPERVDKDPYSEWCRLRKEFSDLEVEYRGIIASRGDDAHKIAARIDPQFKAAREKLVKKIEPIDSRHRQDISKTQEVRLATLIDKLSELNKVISTNEKVRSELFDDDSVRLIIDNDVAGELHIATLKIKEEKEALSIWLEPNPRENVIRHLAYSELLLDASRRIPFVKTRKINLVKGSEEYQMRNEERISFPLRLPLVDLDLGAVYLNNQILENIVPHKGRTEWTAQVSGTSASQSYGTMKLGIVLRHESKDENTYKLDVRLAALQPSGKSMRIATAEANCKLLQQLDVVYEKNDAASNKFNMARANADPELLQECRDSIPSILLAIYELEQADIKNKLKDVFQTSSLGSAFAACRSAIESERSRMGQFSPDPEEFLKDKAKLDESFRVRFEIVLTSHKKPYPLIVAETENDAS